MMTPGDRYAALIGPAAREESLLTVPRKLSEHEVQAHWFAGSFGREFIATDGRRTKIVQFGVWNHEAGPDFAEAAVSFDGGEPVRGSIEQLAGAQDYAAMIAIIERFLLSELQRSRRDLHPVDTVLNDFLSLNIPTIEAMADKACLSYRQFDRKFIERTGISPKEYFRVTRFDQTFRVKNRHPDLDWLSIAMKFGYYDYQHLVRDYKYFTGMTPPQLLSNDNAPEKILGDAET